MTDVTAVEYVNVLFCYECGVCVFSPSAIFIHCLLDI